MKFTNLVWGSLTALLLVVLLNFGSQARAHRDMDFISLAVVPDSTSTTTYLTKSDAIKLYLPIISRKFPRPLSIFGIEANSLTDLSVLRKAAETGNYWVRIHAFDWDEIEPTHTEPVATYNWAAVDETSLRNIANSGMQTIAVVKHTPDWAQKEPGVSCGSIHVDALDDFADFLTAAVRRYSQHPYNVKYWELGNEPDIDPDLVPPDHFFGCWGDSSDEYYGGGYYAEMLNKAYPAIKAANPDAQVLIGGLLLDCDPTNPPAGENCQPAKFLEGILRNRNGPNFDIVSFHGYSQYKESQIDDETYTSWDQRGGVVLGKIDFLREVMTTHGVDKPIIHTEGSLLCSEKNLTECDPPGIDFYEKQADYVIWLYVRNWANNVMGTIWFSFPGDGWRYGGMLGSPNDPKPAYQAYDFMTEILTNATYISPVAEYPELNGYAFTKEGNTIWVLWSSDYSPRTINLPPGLISVYDKFGNIITPTDGDLTITSPVYVESRP